MKKILFYFTIAGTLLMLGGCKKYLEVQPADKYTGDQVYSTEFGIQQSLNGIYDNLVSNTLYGANLTSTIIEAMGQRYNTTASSTGSVNLFQTYTYTDPTALSITNSIWTSMYTNILQDNQFIQQIDIASQKGIVTSAHAAELKGEAIGLRAMMHFDLLRMFGPVYATSATTAAIPYYTKADGVTRAILPASQVIDSVLTDLNNAKTLLAADPVITKGTSVNLNGSDFYSSNRNQRLNYYAVIGLLARAYLYKGDKTNANAMAKLALTDIDAKFPWLPVGNILGNTVPDLVFSTEVMFGLYNQAMYTNFGIYFQQPTAATNLTASTIITALTARLQVVFENNTNDYRYNTTWTSVGTYSYFLKYQTVTDATKTFRFLQPMVRKSELYYILAETEPVAANGINYLNTVRANRNLTALPATAVLATELQKEYQKEFWGEGQIFYFYKRNNLTSIPSGASGTATIAMTAAKYVVPLPLSETTPR